MSSQPPEEDGRRAKLIAAAVAGVEACLEDEARSYRLRQTASRRAWRLAAWDTSAGLHLGRRRSWTGRD